MQPIKGVIAAMDTPFDDDGSISIDRTKALCDFLVDRGIRGLFLCGGTGLVGVLSVQERMKLASVVLEHVKGKIPVLVHVGSPITDDTVLLAKHAADIGAVGIALSSPNWYYRHEDLAIEEHFSIVCSCIELPIFIYRRSVDTWPVETIASLRSRFPHVIGIKDSTTDINQHLDFLSLSNFLVYQGYEPLTTFSIISGACGLVSGLATVFPEEVVKLYDSLSVGDIDAAREQQSLVNNLVNLTYKPSAYPRFKSILAARGCPVGQIRRPFRPLSTEEEKNLLRALNNLGVL